MPHGMSQWARAVVAGANQRVSRDMGLLRGLEGWAGPGSEGLPEKFPSPCRQCQTADLAVAPSSETLSVCEPSRTGTGIIDPMTERGLPPVDGAPACPFV